MELAAFDDNEVCRGHDGLWDDGEQYPMALFSVFHMDNELGLSISFKLYDHFNGIDYGYGTLNIPCLTGEDNFDVYDWDEETTPVISFVSSSVSTTQTIVLSDGWNWFSTSIEGSDDVFGQLKDGVAALNTSSTTSPMIKSLDDGYLTLSNGSWSGSLASLQNEQMYLIKSNGGSVTLTGDPANPTNHPITLIPGWNWIGFVSQNDMTVATALSQITTPNVGDIIKNIDDGFLTYSNGWNGNLSNMVSGKGYLYLNKGNDPITFTYPSSSKEVVDYTPLPKYWNANHNAFPTTLCVMVTLDENEFGMREGSHEIGAFVNGECRGSARLQNVDGRYVAFLSVSGDEGEKVNFQLYDVNSDSMFGTAAEYINYTADAVIGSLSNPMTLHFRNTGLESFLNTLSLYPNPAKDKLTINGEALLTVKIYNALGQMVLVEDCNNNSNVELNMGGLSAGVYTVAVESVFGTANKLVVKE
ncbi:MAG: T9SS type A sorting domain-containing protein [Bacteroidales bacterium]|nr:T9SS type A sorting domain-containing protein [Bacteroidales bacterium]